jgi:anti-anti-sigma factor
MSSRVVRYPEAIVVELSDRPCFSHEDAEQIKQTLCQVGREHARLVIDCDRVQSFGATFLSVLLAAMNRLGARPGDIVLCNVRDLPRAVLRITRLDQVFVIRGSREEAIDSDWPEPTPRIVAGEGADQAV